MKAIAMVLALTAATLASSARHTLTPPSLEVSATCQPNAPLHPNAILLIDASGWPESAELVLSGDVLESTDTLQGALLVTIGLDGSTPHTVLIRAADGYGHLLTKSSYVDCSAD